MNMKKRIHEGTRRREDLIHEGHEGTRRKKEEYKSRYDFYILLSSFVSFVSFVDNSFFRCLSWTLSFCNGFL
ncbi:MAG: hypothetical protein BECKG1743D_GA0114223_100443 [Candidatus Kentron sp. G]|nr:MAG: hypothetical protein BECKG1743E_GA0114224_100413 [Candidatus Kentron sp. G]VFM96662.1 MAG: hypothetical protein BECKG1743F_GA0114225_101833 [Candidatus Kentron sp. G]VFM98086.1 MAG: hypothetical protein BECKG1743D_GA0114223_100443 [Candidatus Kentron sp. G]